MGTQKTIQHKLQYIHGFIAHSFKKMEDISKEKFISHIMMKFFCERRKAMDLIKAAISEFNYEERKIDNEKVYLYKGPVNLDDGKELSN